jgi:hypothetical protein
MASENAYYSLVPNTKSICTYSLRHSWKCLAQLQPETGQPLVFSLKKETVKPEKWQCMNSCALVYRTHTSIFIKNNSKVDGQKIENFKTTIQFQYTNIKWILKSPNNHFHTLQNEKSTTSQWIGGMCIRVTWSYQILSYLFVLLWLSEAWALHKGANLCAEYGLDAWAMSTIHCTNSRGRIEDVA